MQSGSRGIIGMCRCSLSLSLSSAALPVMGMSIEVAHAVGGCCNLKGAAKTARSDHT